jgi:hypothetical protein
MAQLLAGWLFAVTIDLPTIFLPIPQPLRANLMSDNEFQRLDDLMQGPGPESVLAALASSLREQHRYHELFEVLKMQVRRRLGLPIVYTDEGDELPEQQRQALEEGLLDACRQVGLALLDKGQVRDGWIYLRPLGDKKLVAERIAQLPITDDSVDQFIEVLLHEAVDTERGYQLVLEHYGTCNSITTLQSALYGRPKQERRAAGRLLVRHVYRELCQNVKSHIERRAGEGDATGAAAPLSAEHLMPLLEGRPWLCEGGAYHLDTSHLSSTVQIAAELIDPDSLQLAWELTQYGLQLDPQLQYPGEAPFADLYPSHAVYFAAQLGRDADQAIAYFGQQARDSQPRDEGTRTIEVYVDLLARLGRFEEAIDALTAMIPPGIQLCGIAPTLYELCAGCHRFDKMARIAADRGDILSYTVALLNGARSGPRQAE